MTPGLWAYLAWVSAPVFSMALAHLCSEFHSGAHLLWSTWLCRVNGKHPIYPSPQESKEVFLFPRSALCHGSGGPSQVATCCSLMPVDYSSCCSFLHLIVVVTFCSCKSVLSYARWGMWTSSDTQIFVEFLLCLRHGARFEDIGTSSHEIYY